jgi:hypothetical protein
MAINSVLRFGTSQDNIATDRLQSRFHHSSLIAVSPIGQGTQPTEKNLNYFCPGDRRCDGRWWPWA